jgi:type IX secretion system substrate protein
MKKVLLILLCAVFTYSANAQIRLLAVSPSTETVTIKNFGSNTVDISAYRLCSKFSYSADLTTGITLLFGSLNLAAGDTVIIQGFMLDDAAADLGLYLPTGQFSDTAAMQDWTQWGGAGNGRENEAVTKGIWSTADFISDGEPYLYIGDGTQNGLAFWQGVVTGIADKDEAGVSITVYPNPATEVLNINIGNNAAYSSIEVLTIDGKTVMTQSIGTKNTYELNVSQLGAGNYFIKVISAKGVSMKQFAIQK